MLDLADGGMPGPILGPVLCPACASVSTVLVFLSGEAALPTLR